MENEKVLVALSGGLDSTILLYKMIEDFGKENVNAFSIDYNQKHDIELIQAKKTTDYLGIKHEIIKMDWLYEIVKNVSSMVKNNLSAKNDSKEYMPNSYVPFRNYIISGIIAAYAESNNIHYIAEGIMKEEISENKVRYWDTTEAFSKAIQNVFKLNDQFKMNFITPFVNMTKADELRLAKELDVRLEHTWTCYNPFVEKVTDYHFKYTPCGTCPSCVGRANAFKEVGMEDPVVKNGVIL